jgi:hypothetical protein
MANTIDFNVSTNAVTVLNQTGAAAENTAKSFTSAKAELRALQQQLLQMDQTSEAFKVASARAAELKDNIGDLSAEINANAGNAFEGLSNNVGLFGSRLMDLDLKGAGQALTAMGGAVGRIDFKTLKDEVGGLVKGLANLGKAVLANPFFLAAAALTAMIVYYKEIGDLINGTAEKVKKLEEGNVVLEKQNQILDARINKEKTLYGESFRTLKLEKEKAQNNITVAENELAIARTTGDINVIREKENKLIEMRNLLSGITNKGEADRVKLVEEAKNLTVEGYKEEQEKAAAISKFEDARQQQLLVIANKQAEISASIQLEKIKSIDLFKVKQQDNESTSKYNKLKYVESEKIVLTTEKQKKLQEELNKLNEEEKILRNAKLAIATGTTVNELKAEQLAIQKELNKEGKTAEQIQKEADDAEIARRKKLNDDMMAESDHMASIDLNDLIEREKKKTDAKLLGEMQYHANLTALQSDQSQKELDASQKLEEQKKQQRIQLAEQGFSALSALGDAYFSSQLANVQAGSKAELDLKKKQFAFNKKMQIGGAIMDTAKAITAAIAANPFPSPTLPVSIALASITGAAQIAKIASTKFDGGGGGSGGVNIPTTGADGTTAPSPANFAFLQNQPNQQPPLQAYVVGTQVSSNLEAQQLIQNQSRLGG